MTDTSETAFDALHVLSDLHLAPAGRCVLRAHAELVGLIDWLTAQPGRQALLLNGDVFDFLQIAGYAELSLPLAAERMHGLLKDLQGEPPSRDVPGALRRYTAAGHTLYCLAGNHDPELHLGAVQQVLSEHLGSRPWPDDGAGHWRLSVAGRTVLGVHGHDGDAFNAISGARMRRAEAEQALSVPLPPGSRLVRDVFNPYRFTRTADDRQPYVFVDALSSQRAVALGLLLLDPRLAMQRLELAVGVTGPTLKRKLMLATGIGASQLASDRPVKGEVMPSEATQDDAMACESSPDGADWETALAACLADAMRSEADVVSPARFEREWQAMMDGRLAVVAPPETPLLSAADHVRRVIKRALFTRLCAMRTDAPLDTPDAVARACLQRWGGSEAIIVTGHTHIAKRIVTAGGLYLNTASWLDELDIPSFDDPDAILPWFEAIAAGQARFHRRCPVARIDADGAGLWQWDGTALQPWPVRAD